MIKADLARNAEFKKGLRDGFCRNYTNGNVSFEGDCKIVPHGKCLSTEEGQIFEGKKF